MRNRTEISFLGILLLAAGSSTRMGRPKQLLSFKGSTFLYNSVNTALAADAGATIVVLGANAVQMREEINGMPVDIVVNEQYKEGMATSIKSGLQFVLKKYPQTDGVLIMLCDQPYVNLSHIRRLVEVQMVSGAAIVASLYDNIQGVPAIFHKNIFSELLRLKGDKGARQIIRLHHDESESVPFPPGNMDIDTPDAYKVLLNHRKTEGEC